MYRLITLFAALLFLAGEGHGAKYMGCYMERSYRDRLFKAAFATYPEINNTHQVCQEYCGNKGFVYAGVQFGRECFCDNTPPPAEFRADSENECNQTCQGNRNELCGSWMRMGIFNLIQPNSEVQNYEGCYAPNALKFSQEVPSALTRETCQNACTERRFKYYGMEGGSRCFCGSELHSEKRSDEECQVQCDGNKFQLCGGNSQQISVFRSDVPENEVFDESPTTVAPTTEEIPTEPEMAEEPTEESTIIEEPATEEPENNEPETEELPAEEPVTEELPAEEPATEESPAEEPEIEGSLAEEPAPEDSPAEEPAIEGSPAEEPAPEESPANEPAIEEAATTTAAPIQISPTKSPKQKCPCPSSSSESSSSSSSEEENCKCGGKLNLAYAYGKPLGCFNDPKYNCLKVYLESPRNSVDLCVEVCNRRKLSYAALRGKQCLCGKSAPQRRSKDCQFRCPGNPTDLCGGKKSMNVFEINAQA